MSASQTPGTPGASSTSDPSMEDILASIRRILSEEEQGAPPAEAPAMPGEAEPPAVEEHRDDVLVLDPSMLVHEQAGPPVEPPPVVSAPDATPPLPQPPLDLMSAGGLLAPETEAAAATSVSSLMRTLASGRTLQAYRGGPTIEDLVREELRPLLKQWLDNYLPELVERLVRAEIERVVGRAVP
jgi:cell pole-organizing protein PopZ